MLIFFIFEDTDNGNLKCCVLSTKFEQCCTKCVRQEEGLVIGQLSTNKATSFAGEFQQGAVKTFHVNIQTCYASCV